MPWALAWILLMVRKTMNFKMVAAKPVTYIQSLIRKAKSIYQLLDNTATLLKRLAPSPLPPLFLVPGCQRILHDVTGSRIFKLTVANPEIYTSQLLDNIATLLKRQTSNFVTLFHAVR